MVQEFWFSVDVGVLFFTRFPDPVLYPKMAVQLMRRFGIRKGKETGKRCGKCMTMENLNNSKKERRMKLSI